MRISKIVSSILIVIIAIACFSPALAEDSPSPYCTTNPDDASGLPECYTPEDNECYVGGVLDGKCDNQWLWDAGWYLARFNWGQISRDSFPVLYISVLPPLPEEAPTSGGSITVVCKVGFGNRYCAYLNKTGTRDTGNDGSVEEVQAFFPNGTATCPAGYLGPYPITNWHGGLFSDADLAPLGMDNTWVYCYKFL